MEQIFTDPFAPLQVSPITVGGETMQNKIAIQVKADDGSWSLKPSVVSTDYTVITNAEARDCVDDIMTRSQYSWRPLKQHWDGKRYIAYHLTNEKITTLARDGKTPHDIHLGMMMRNSYDGSSIFGIELFIANMACTNQYTARNLFGSFAIRHNNREWDFNDALQQIGRGAQNAISVVPKLSMLTSMPLTPVHIIEAHKHTKIPTSKWGEVLGALDTDVEDSGKLYGLFQAMTYVTSHKMDGLSSLRAGESVMQWVVPR